MRLCTSALTRVLNSFGELAKRSMTWATTSIAFGILLVALLAWARSIGCLWIATLACVVGAACVLWPRCLARVFGDSSPLPTVGEFTAGLGEEERVGWLRMPKYTSTGFKQLPLPMSLRQELQEWYRNAPREPEDTNAHLVGDVRICSLAGTRVEERLRFAQPEGAEPE